ncbi:chemotaxis protein CheA [Frigidibacter mobilis]|uniref:Chemotaxis protein CheA n=1 Tax=Frigidibacter mobilis TaxID=1335048 RepID=A0A159Z6H9_9RHOB|nr:chemotaxis protein CheA [Frigidibacter mobilis]AMY70955.1 chemotaxis protein CheA [Frigidibacter mobilis]
MDDINPAIATFVQEARDLLEGLEGLLLDLERGADPGQVDPVQVDAVFRTLHTIKGSGAMFGFGTLAQFTHHFEEAFDRVREGKLSIDQRLIDLSLRARDHMTALLDCGSDGAAADELATGQEASDLLVGLAAITGEAPPVKTAEPGAGVQDAAGTARMRRWSILFRPEPSALRNGMRPDLLMAELAGFGTLDMAVDVSAVPPLEDLAADECLLAWRCTLETDKPRSVIEAVFIFADDAQLEIEEIADPADESRAATGNAGTAPAARAQAAKPAANAPGESVRVPAGKLDEIMDQLGELVIVQARLNQISSARGDAELESVAEEVERLVTGLRDATLSVRMMPIEAVFGKFRRVVRDLSAELSKDVALITEGGETEIDKNVIDRLSEPLVHMIRNSMDHGLEGADRRRAAGKPVRGTVRLSARQEGGEVLIAIEDDGAGLDAEAIRAKALERGLLSPDAQPTTTELHQLIFSPGFSTAKALSSVSGRGVGMDAVRSTVDALRGTVEVMSHPGRGTRVTLRLPVTLAIIDGLLVRLGEAVFVIPLSVVEECVEMEVAERRRESGRTILQIREHLVPFLDLDDVFSRPPSTEPRRRVVIVKADGARIGLVVDDILGQNQTVIKTLSVYHRDVQGFAGATILGDGGVALIIDVAMLARRAQAERAAIRPVA